jgi:hypothetical protein
MTDDGPIPDGLPAVLSLAQLMWLVGLTKARIGQLVSEGAIIKLGRDQYAIGSVPKFVAYQRARNIGPGQWNSARSELALERAATAKLHRLALERKLLPRERVIAMSCSIVGAARDRFLGLPTKVAHKVALESKAANCEKILYTEVCEILQELAGLEVVAERVAPDGR